MTQHNLSGQSIGVHHGQFDKLDTSLLLRYMGTSTNGMSGISDSMENVDKYVIPGSLNPKLKVKIG